MYRLLCISSLLFLFLTSCQDAGVKSTPASDQRDTFPEGSFGFDRAFLKRYDTGLLLLQAEGGNAQVLVSPKYQAKVFTSTAAGEKGQSFGWVNYKAFDEPVNKHMNAYGGENRFWLGPEGGRFALFFQPGDSMVFANWRTPPAIDTEPWEVVKQSAKEVTLAKQMQLTNYAGTVLQLSVRRAVRLLEPGAIETALGILPPANVQGVGYETSNVLTNAGNNAWTEKTGMPCIWILDMFKPSDRTVITIPFDAKGKKSEQVVSSDYFGVIGKDRLTYAGNLLLFRADGESRGKLGVGPAHARPVAGSYDATNKVLTITLFDVAADQRYLNQEWNTQKPVFSGDAVNAYNDGPLADGSQMGPFYEIESVSQAAALKPGASLSHRHAVFHFSGAEEGLDQIAQKVLGISLDKIGAAFNP